MVLANGVGGASGVKAYFALLILSLTVTGNCAELCSNIGNTGLKCSPRTNALIAIGAIAALLVIIALVLRALGSAAAFHAELILLIVSGIFWVAAAAVVSSHKTSILVLRTNTLSTDGSTGRGADFLSTAPFFASWISLMLVVALLGDAVAKANLVLPQRPPSQAAPSPLTKPVNVPSGNDPTAFVGDAGGSAV
ncbi:hypothetical protein BU14_2329s0001 [Porphyra umbilicalis]|uniref:MARVEL domain-containing protein n=1 Tax=Porphyra umbilicalis TaxID=2786 RepID=A0A1X6NJD3_PORUM|nr:hypothetical protein BU14_2329s0001 [Porphyra umbilicalis]|eukprot:OSX68727.1 hypothetical protein BU14_2329s0001 [Porphyra umbilicalis]